MENKKTVDIYDIETLLNCFTYSAIDKDSDKIVKFVCWGQYNQIDLLLEHLSSLAGMVGFNNLAFDYPVIHWILLNKRRLLKMSGDEVARLIYNEAQRVIKDMWPNIKEQDIKIPQLDLFTIWHFNNRARITSLKKIEIAMDFDNVQDMPIHHSEEVLTVEQVKQILEYNINDIKATKAFYILTQPKIELRKGLLKKYGLDCLNYPDSKIGEELMLKLYCHFTGKQEHKVKQMRTHRKIFKFAESIPDYIKFETPEFNQLMEYLKSIEVTELKGSFKYDFEYKGFEFALGTGGIHGCIKAGVYKSTDTYVIVDADVASLYPSLGITLNLYPQHLGEEFSQIYSKGIVEPRLAAKKSGDKVMADGFKLSANSVYGKSNSEFSFLYDPLYTLNTTLAGQLALCMLSEMLMVGVPDLQMLQINTDGLSVSIPVEHKRLYWNICKEWEKKTNLVLEYIAYKQMIIRDVNSYIAEDVKGKIKYKGALRPKNISISEGDWHKNFSQDIVTQAICEYFLKDIPVEKTINECKDIYSFCKMFNATHGWKCETVIDENTQEQQKTNRYYISNSGATFRKIKDEKIIEIEAGGTLVTILNKYVKKEISDYDINYQYYIDEAYKIIHKIDGTEEILMEEARLKREEEKKRKDAEKLEQQKEREEQMFIKYCMKEEGPTQLQYDRYAKDWLIDKYGEPKNIR